MHKTTKAVTADLSAERYIFNTAIARCMELVNGMYKFTNESQGDNGNAGPVYTEKQKTLLVFTVRTLLLLLAPMAPHIAEELWQATGFREAEKKFVHFSQWPTYDESMTIDNQIELVLQVNGKIVNKVAAPRGLAKDQARNRLE